MIARRGAVGRDSTLQRHRHARSPGRRAAPPGRAPPGRAPANPGARVRDWDQGDRGDSGSRKRRHRPGARRRRCRRPGLPGRRPAALTRDRVGPARRPSSSAPRPARSPVGAPRRRAVPPTWRPRSRVRPSPRRRPFRAHPPRRRWTAPPRPSLAAAAVDPALPGAAHAGGPLAARLPPRGGGHHAAARGSRHLERAAGRRAHGDVGRTACGSASVANRRRPRASAGPAHHGDGPGRACASCAIPGYFRTAPSGAPIRRRRRALGHERRRAALRRPRPGRDRLPPCRPPTAARTGRRLFRRTVHRRMERKIARLEAAGRRDQAGTRPGGRGRAMGLRAMAEDRGSRVIEAALRGDRTGAIDDAPVLASLGRPCRHRLHAGSPRKRHRPVVAGESSCPKGGSR